MQFQETIVPAGSGISERQLHLATGLRNAQLNAVISSNYAGIFATTAGFIGTADGSRHGTWPTGIRAAGSAWNSVMPVPMTPSLTFYVVPAGSGFPETVGVKIKMKGTDQFGCYQEEVTPWISKVMTTTSQWFMVHMSKVFATVDEVYVMTSNIINTANISQVGCGWGTNIDPTRGASATMSAHSYELTWEFFHAGTVTGAVLTTNLDLCGTAANWGIGTPLRVEPYGPNTPFPTPEILGATGTIIREKTTPTVLGVTAKIPVRGQLSVSGAAPTTGLCVGRSAAGWQGTPHKIGFFSNDSWTTKVSGLELGGSSNRASDVPTSEGQVGEDELMFTVLMRTHIGTRRDSNPTRTYPRG